MCEYCGCQAVAAVAELTAEHDAVVALVAQVRTALATGRTDAAAGLCRVISAVLGPHTYVEERGLFPALADSFPDHRRGAHRRARHHRACPGCYIVYRSRDTDLGSRAPRRGWEKED